ARPARHSGNRTVTEIPTRFNQLLTSSPVQIRKAFQRKIKQGLWMGKNVFTGNSEEPFIPRLGDILNLEDYPQDLIPIAEHHWQLLNRHRQKPYPGEILLITSGHDPDDALGWDTVADSVAIARVDFPHEALLQDPDALHAIGEQVANYLEHGEVVNMAPNAAAASQGSP
ncbi:MAG: hypothetical protein AAF514_23580, partial [Verrucomicrobiota bacterium]